MNQIALPHALRRFRPARWLIALVVLFLLMFGFVRHSAGMGIAGLLRDLSGLNPFYAADAPWVTGIMFLHMVTGAILTLQAPLQLIGPIRRMSRGFHRWNGRAMIVFGLITGFGGIVYACLRGTTGGLFMDISSTAYGILIFIAAVQTYRLGRAKKWKQHERWGWRLSVLVISSWLYRMHYVIWDRLTGGWGTTPDMTGPFDQFQAWGFFLGYLLLLEVYFIIEASRKKRGPARG
ncbi:DUF2306 domain-containing protein [Pseudorhodobacter aquimaris]|uniref:DUF2306 domain-containing protein n=1 Tax=Pseudorhodobacter aquimaris TaxID=687412 RepID=UPI00067DAEB9|nr:DUF2306 domain-containing protein [Pseudorhodobacter aquimaris]